MAKKDFKTGGFQVLLGEEVSSNVQKDNFNSKNKDAKIRATFILDYNQYEKIKYVSYWERILIKDIVEEALENYIKSYEAIKGTIIHSASDTP